MKRAELQQVRRVMDDAMAILDAELAKPEMAREWGVQYNDAEVGLVVRNDPASDTDIYRFAESEARQIVAGDSRRRLFTRTESHLVPAGPWERAE